MSTIPHPPGEWLVPATGALASHAEIIADMAARQVVLLGETHDRFDIHRWQLHVAAGLLASGRPLMVGFEMFPRRVQPALDAFVAGDIEADAFIEQSEWENVWGFDPELYLPLFHFCRQFKLPMLALNCHRPLVTRIGKQGWDAVPEAERDGLTPARPATPAARQFLFDITGGGRFSVAASAPDDPGFDRFVRAQGVWDRAFAVNIAKALDRRPDALVLGIIGRGHMKYGHGTPFQLADLGVERVGVLLPGDADFTPSANGPIADAVFRLDTRQIASRPRREPVRATP
ncbi:ChaN family lipoprotein [Devosia sp.]|uniref:ChaN family lipoprotein n=1 Tax=Devosia sp. TaxID=1871048 RepID=UPI002AFF6DF0|nr:ChaN family lipoprotein [Devosia sp.]